MTTLLLTSAAKVTLVLTATLLLTRAAAHRSAAARHWILTVGVLAALVEPVLSVGWPRSLAAPVLTRSMARLAPEPAPVAFATAASVDGFDAAGVTTRAPEPERGSPESLSGAFQRAAGAVWMVGVALALSRLAWGLAVLGRVVRTATPVTAGPVRAMCDAESGRLGLRRPVRLLQSDHPALAVTWGWWRPGVLLPAQSATWPSERRQVVLAHELAHVVRGDWLAQLAGELLRAIHWYHPLAWSANRRLRIEGERAADDVVLAGGVSRADYASHLVALADRARGATAWMPAPAVARASSLEGRIRAMLDTSIDRHPLTRGRRAGIATLAFVALLPLAAVTAAQAPLHTLHGTIVDPTGRVLPNVTVALANDDTAARFEVQSNENGRYAFVGLLGASYTLKTTLRGFQPLTASVAVSSDRELPLRLSVGTLQETITITSSGDAPPPVDAAAVDMGRAREAERRARASERQAKAVATCAAAPPTHVGGNILPPWKIRHANPHYPEQAKAAGLGGTVTMQAVIDATGAVRDVRDVKGPSPDLESAAVEAVRAWQFTPTLLNCEAIEVEMRVTLDFKAPK
jgi:TonB family protein